MEIPKETNVLLQNWVDREMERGKSEAILALSQVRKECLQEDRMSEADLLRQILLTTKEEPHFTLATLLRRMVDSMRP